MILLLALTIPFGISFVMFVLTKNKITPTELAAQLGVIAAFLSITYAIMLYGNTSDVELLNGSIQEKHQYTEGCCHSYPCNCHEVCSGSGKDRSCSEHCDTCYRHAFDIGWSASSTLGTTVFNDGCNSPHSSPPPRWDRIYVGEPASEEHSFTNYIMANPQSVLRQDGVSKALLDQVPDYPVVYDHYNADRFMSLGVRGVDVVSFNHELKFINAQLGAKKQVNIIVMITAQGDPMFGEAVRQKWLGGKKNDVIVIVGTPNFPEIAWVNVQSWTREEAMKINIRDNILTMHTFDGHKILGITAYEVDQGFKRRHWQDFDYLKAGIEPSSTETVVLFVLALLLSASANYVTYRYDLFEETETYRRYSRRNY